MSVQKRKFSDIGDHGKLTAEKEQQAWSIIMTNLQLKNIEFQKLYDTLVVVAPPLDAVTRQLINDTLRNIINFFREDVLKIHYYHPTTMGGVPSLQSLSTKEILKHLTREDLEREYKDLMKQTILVCMRIWRFMFGIRDIQFFHSYLIRYDHESGLPIISMSDVYSLVSEMKQTDYYDPVHKAMSYTKGKKRRKKQE